MGEKDLTEKILEDYDDVFADIINVLLLNGEERVKPEELSSTSVHSQYKANTGVLHEQERDISKFWKKGNIKFSLFGIENQTKPVKYMPFRVIGYDGASYREQLLVKKKNDSDMDDNTINEENTKVTPIPVITIVLYFGTEKQWNYPCNLKALIDIPEWLDEYVNDYKINLFEIAWLSEENIKLFKSDFGIVANFFRNKRLYDDYVPDDERVITHVDAVLKLLSVMTGDNKYESLLKFDKKEGITMCDVAERLDRRGYERGLAQGIEKGIEKGRKEAAINFYKNKIPVKIIADSLCLSENQIMEWLREKELLNKQEKDKNSSRNTNTMNLF